MNPNDVIESYVLDVMRRLPGKERNEIGLELRGLLTEMLVERAGTEGRVADDAMVLAMLRDFGTPADVSARYRPAEMVIIPATQTRAFVLVAGVGVGLQWALTLPRVFAGQSLGIWWLSWGLGSFWWPGLMVMLAFAAAALRHKGWAQPMWRPRVVDPDRLNRGAMLFGLVWFVLGMAFMISLPWVVPALPDPLPRVFAFDAGFVQQRAWPIVILWLGSLAVRGVVCSRGRWSLSARWLDIGVDYGFIALLLWWLFAGPVFQVQSVNNGARTALALILCLISMGQVFKFLKLHRRRSRLRALKGVV